MTYVIGSLCVDVCDSACLEACPVDCIVYEEGVDRKAFIDPEECVDCNACVDPCPVSAIFAEEDMPESEQVYMEIDALYYEDREAARKKLEEVRPHEGLKELRKE